MNSLKRMAMRSATILVAGFVAASLMLATPPAVAASGAPLAPGDFAPKMVGKDLAGGTVSVDYSASKVTLLNFWATWCGPCRDEMPMLQQMHESFEDQGLRVVAITFEETDNATISTFLENLNLSFTVMKPLTQIRPLWVGVEGILPNSYLVGPDGRVLRRYVGASPEQIVGMRDDLAAVIEGRQMGPLVMPETPSYTTADDYQKQRMEEARKKHEEEQRRKR